MFEYCWKGPENILELKIHGMLSDRETERIDRLIESHSAESGSIKLFLDVEGFASMDPEGLLENLKFIRTHEVRVRRLAVVGNRAWIKAWVVLGGLFLETAVRYFDRSERVAARQWLLEPV